MRDQGRGPGEARLEREGEGGRKGEGGGGLDVGLGVVHEGGGARGVRLGRFDEFFIGVCEGGGLVDCIGEVRLESNLASKGPGAFHSGVIGE